MTDRLGRYWYTEQEVSRITGFTPKTLQKWRLDGDGPFPFIRVGRSIRYPVKEFYAALDAMPRCLNTGEADDAGLRVVAGRKEAGRSF